MPSINEILLRVTGDTDDAEKDLGTLAAELSAFDRQEAEATLDLEDERVHAKLRAIEKQLSDFARETATADTDIDTQKARAELQVLQAGLDRIDGQTVSAEVNAQVTQAMLKLQALDAELTRIDSRDIDVDVDVRRGVAERVLALSGSLGKLAGQGEKATGAFGGMGDAADDMGFSFGNVSGKMGVWLKLLPLLIPIVTALAGAVAAVVASLLSAVGGVAALSVAFGGSLIPVVALAIGAFKRFEETSGEAGSAAARLKEQASQLAGSFLEVTKTGADKLFAGLADALRTLRPVIQELGPMFTELGRAGGEAARILARQLASPGMVDFLKQMGSAAADLAPLFARSFGAMARILGNIAVAAMPFLIRGFREVAGWLGEVANKTGDIGGLRRVIGGMVDSLGAWIDLMGGIIDLTGAFVKVFAPVGDSIVRSLGDGARNLADWLRSSEGMDKIKQFFEDTGPLASEVAKLILNVSLALAQIGQFLAPALTPIFKGFNELIGVLNTVLSWLNDSIPAGVRGALGSLIGFVAGFGKIRAGASIASAAIRFLVGLAGSIGGAFQGAVAAAGGVARGIGSAMRSAWHAVQNAQERIRDVLLGGWRAIRDFTRNIWSGVRDTMRDRMQAARDAVRNITTGIRDIARNVFHAIRDFTRSIWQGIRESIRNQLSTARDAVRNIGQGMRDVARNIWQSIRSATSSIWQGVRTAIQTAMQNAREVVSSVGANIREAAANSFRGVMEAARSILSSLGSVVGNAFRAAASAVRSAGSAIVSAARSIWEAVKSVLSVPISLNIQVPDVKIPNPFSAVTAATSSLPSFEGDTGFRTAPAGGTVNHFDIHTADGDYPDADTFLAQVDAQLRLRGA